MAEVFLAKVEGPMGFEKSLVLKRILPHLAENEQFVEMFFTEARVAAQLNHPHIVQIFDFGQAEDTYYLAMEYIDGPDLRALSRRSVRGKEPLPPAFCAKVIAAACEGLAFAHDFVDSSSGEPLGLIHRDISPDNILLSRQGTVKVVDFGIAKAANQSHKTTTGLIKGKLAYMPPEQLQGMSLDRRVDVYSLGMVLYELLTGTYPFDANTDVSMMQAILYEPQVSAATRRPELPTELVRILGKALAKEREQRYADCIAFQTDLERFIRSTGESVGARDLAQVVEKYCPRNPESPRSAPIERAALQTLPEHPPPETPAPPSRRGRIALGIALGGLVLAAGTGVVLVRGPGTSPTPVAAAPPPRPVVEPAAVAPPPPEPTPEPTPEPAPEPQAAPPVIAEKAPEKPPGVEPAPVRVPQKGKLTIRVRPYATVFLDGTALGQTPLAPVTLSAGTHTLRLINRDLDKDVTRTVEVKPGQPTLFTLDFQAD
ncbi:serine/threonine protein kinase [Melittangium boletus]|uniref:Protein kinase domain-containing protein n=1 Tax=Melittangium boletus DSM 14713 TaxID=1294270 RepID=A0A250I9Z3_9BACT|nr:hypothetical protein MEBOL_001221 [Melittangium boletus DSM 14713]